MTSQVMRREQELRAARNARRGGSAQRLERSRIALEVAPAAAARLDLRIAELEALAPEASVVLEHGAREERRRERVDHDREPIQLEHGLVVALLRLLQQVLKARAAAALDADAEHGVGRAALGLTQSDRLDAG